VEEKMGGQGKGWGSRRGRDGRKGMGRKAKEKGREEKKKEKGRGEEFGPRCSRQIDATECDLLKT
jgi:hypothetical protein